MIPVFAIALSGALLVLLQPSSPRLLANDSEARNSQNFSPLERALQDAVEEHGPMARYVIRPPRGGNEFITVQIDSARWHGKLYYHPASGLREGSASALSDPALLLLDFHDSLFLGETGKLILLAVAIGALLLTATGMWIWFKTSVKAKGLSNRWLHRWVGITGAVLIAITFATGAYMAWRPLSALVNQVSGVEAFRPPKLKTEHPGVSLSLEGILSAADKVLPGGRIGYVIVSPGGRDPIRVRKKFDDDPHPNGLSSVWIHPGTGEVLTHIRWDSLDPGSKLFSWIYPLHVGVLWGSAHRLSWLIVGLTCLLLSYSGLRIWMSKRRRQENRNCKSPPSP